MKIVLSAVYQFYYWGVFINNFSSLLDFYSLFFEVTLNVFIRSSYCSLWIYHVSRPWNLCHYLVFPVFIDHVWIYSLFCQNLIQSHSDASESRIQLKDEDDHVDESGSLEAQPVNQKRDRRRSAGVRMKGYLSMTNSEVASSKTSKRAKGSVSGVSAIAEENPDSHQSISKTSSRKKKMLAPKVRLDSKTSFSFVHHHYQIYFLAWNE